MTPPDPNRSNRLLITAGPTHEPIDEVRYIGNRSSGRLGAALADRAVETGWSVTLLLGPQAIEPKSTQVSVVRFQTAADLQARLAEHAPRCDALVMAAAVADYRPDPAQVADGKLKRTGEDMVLHLEPVPDLIAAEAARRRDDQLFVAFALEPRERLLESAAAKLARKGVDLIVANPLETMDAGVIEAVLLTPEGAVGDTQGQIPKADFAAWLIDRLERLLAAKASDRVPARSEVGPGR